MIARARTWWSGLSLRERWLVGVAGLLAGATLLWALGRPAYAAFADLDATHRAAIEREGRVATKVQLLQHITPAVNRVRASAGSIDQYLTQSASEIGLTLDRNEPRGDRQATIAIASARASVLTGWLAALEAQGFVVDQLTITPGVDGNVGMTAELHRSGA